MRSRRQTPWTWPGAAVAAGLVACVATATGCAVKAGDGTSNSYVIVDSLLGASGAAATVFSGTIASDVETIVTREIGGQMQTVSTVFEDIGQVTFRLGLRDPGTAATPTAPTTSNFVTLTRYHVAFTRSDGRNTPGVDVPAPFDGAMTVTVRELPVSASFAIVRAQAKTQAPLVALVGGGAAAAIATIAEVTFTGTDQTGREVTVTGRIGVTFSDWAD